MPITHSKKKGLRKTAKVVVARPKKTKRTAVPVKNVAVRQRKNNRGPKKSGFDWNAFGKGALNIASKIGGLISGFGDYRVNNNSLMAGGMSPATIVNSSNTGGTIVRHREYLGDVFATEIFSSQSYPLNPGLDSSFPWLASMAQNFEEYQWRGLIFEFKSTCADNVLSTTTTSTALGTIIMATQYNVLQPNFQDKLTMENHEFACSSKPSMSFIHPVECKANLTTIGKFFIRTGNVAVGDLRFYDLGSFQIATSGMAFNGGAIGELWASYEVELYKPRIISNLGFNLLSDHYNITAATSSIPFGTNFTLNSGSTLGTVLTGTTITFPPNIVDGTYLVIYNVDTGSGSGSDGFSLSATSNCNFTKTYFYGPSSVLATFALTSATYCRIVVITGPSAVLSCSSGGLNSFTGGDLLVFQINSALN
jgi:hypothetical protein